MLLPRTRCLVILVALMVGAVPALSPVAFAQAATPSNGPGASASADPARGGRASTPEDAVRRYLSGVAANDFEAVLEASAMDEAAEHFRFDAFIDERRAFFPAMDLAPPVHPFYQDLNRLQLADAIRRQLLMLVYSILTSEPIGPVPIRVDDLTWTRSFVDQIDPTRLARMDVSEIRFPDASVESDPRWLASVERQVRMLGADDLTQRLALLSLGDQLYDVGFTLVRYGDEWKVLEQRASLGDTDSLGAARPTTLEEFDTRTRGGAEAS